MAETLQTEMVKMWRSLNESSNTEVSISTHQLCQHSESNFSGIMLRMFHGLKEMVAQESGGAEVRRVSEVREMKTITGNTGTQESVWSAEQQQPRKRSKKVQDETRKSLENIKRWEKKRFERKWKADQRTMERCQEEQNKNQKSPKGKKAKFNEQSQNPQSNQVKLSTLIPDKMCIKEQLETLEKKEPENGV